MILGINPYIITDGNGQEAVKFYEEVLGAKVLGIQTFADMPQNPESPVSDQFKNRIIHAHLKVGDTDLMISDTFPGPHQASYQLGSQVTIAISIDNEEESNTIFEKLLDGGQEVMPLQETFFSPSYGQVIDRFGVCWHVSTYVANGDQ